MIIIEYWYLTVPTMYACHPLQRCMYHGVVICVWVSALHNITPCGENEFASSVDLNFSITDPGSKAPDPGSRSARTDYVFLTPKNVAMLAEI